MTNNALQRRKPTVETSEREWFEALVKNGLSVNAARLRLSVMRAREETRREKAESRELDTLKKAEEKARHKHLRLARTLEEKERKVRAKRKRREVKENSVKRKAVGVERFPVGLGGAYEATEVDFRTFDAAGKAPSPAPDHYVGLNITSCQLRGIADLTDFDAPSGVWEDMDEINEIIEQEKIDLNVAPMWGRGVIFLDTQTERHFIGSVYIIERW